jgi:hypothetical protein
LFAVKSTPIREIRCSHFRSPGSDNTTDGAFNFLPRSVFLSSGPPYFIIVSLSASLLKCKHDQSVSHIRAAGNKLKP